MKYVSTVVTLLITLTFNIGDTYAAISPQPIKVKIAALNVRSSPEAKNSSNLVVGCQIKKSDPAVFATDFKFVNGTPWCKIRLPETAGCPADQDVWVAGGNEFVEVDERPVETIYSAPAQKNNTEAKPCATCALAANNPATDVASSLALDEQAIKLGPPIMMTNNCTGADCNCRGLSSTWGPRRHPQGGQRSNHRGCDIAAPKNTPVYAAADGVITMAGWLGDFGNRIEIEHFDNTKPAATQIESENDDVIGAKDGQYISVFACGIERKKYVDSLATTYSHLQKIAPGIKPGSVVKKGDLIGFVNSKGLSTGDHLHFEVEPVGLDCQNGKFGDTCDPQLLHGFPSQTRKWSNDYHCYGFEDQK